MEERAKISRSMKGKNSKYDEENEEGTDFCFVRKTFRFIRLFTRLIIPKDAKAFEIWIDFKYSL